MKTKTAKIEPSKQDIFEKLPVPQALRALAVPAIISQLINLIYNLVDAVYIGMTGDAYKAAAVSLVITISAMLVAFINLFGIGGGSFMARLLGSGKPEKARSVCALSFYGMLLVSLLYSLGVGLFLDPLLYMLGASADTILFARQYVIQVIVIGAVPTALGGVCAHLLRNSGYSKQASFGLSMGGVLNIILDPLFMFVLLPPGQEVLGAAIATLLSNCVSCVYLIITLIKTSKVAALSISPAILRHVGLADIRQLLKVGIPTASLTALFDVANIVLNALMSAHGDFQLAALGIVMRAERIPNAINIGLCQGMMPIVAYNFASGDHKRMNDTVKTTRKYGIIVSLAALLLFELAAPYICRLFLSTGSDAQASMTTLAFAALFMRLRAFGPMPQFINYNMSFSMQATGNGGGTILHACVRELVFYIPFMFLLDHFFGHIGLALAVVLGEGGGALFALWLFARWKKKKNIITE